MATICLWGVCLCGAVLSAARDDGAGAPPASQPAAPPAVQLSASAYPDDVADEAAYADYLQRQTEALLTQVQQAQDLVSEARCRLATANWILARQIEPQVTRLLLGIASEADRGALAALVAQAQQELSKAGELLASSDGQGDEPTSEEAAAPDGAGEAGALPEDLQAIHRDLTAFADALALAWADAETEEASSQARQAAGLLAVLLEDQRPQVAAAATLYQALLYQRAGRGERARVVLDVALQTLPDGGESLALFSRLLRCRSLAEDGAQVVAYSLLLRLEERCQEWFTLPDELAQASRAVALVRRHVLESWPEPEDQAAAADLRAWRDAAIGRLDELTHQDGDPPPVMRLGSAIPLLLDPQASARAE